MGYIVAHVYDGRGHINLYSGALGWTASFHWRQGYRVLLSQVAFSTGVLGLS